MPTITKLLIGHVSPETAYVVESYPYGGLRCKKRFWLETNKKGTRFCSQTTNPKRTNEFDATASKSKASTYSDTMAMYLDEQNHVQQDSLSFSYSEPEQMRRYLTTYGEAATNRSETERYARLKEIFEEELNRFTPRPDYGTPFFKEAYQAAIYRSRAENVNPHIPALTTAE